MAQAPLRIQNRSAAQVLAAINAANHANASMSSGTTAPPNPLEGQLWRDTSGTDDVLRVWETNKWNVATFGSAAPSGLARVETDGTINGDGLTGSPLSVATPFTSAEKTKLAGLTPGGGPLTQEKVYDQTKEIVKAGSNITVTQNDSTNEITIASTGGGSGNFDFDELKGAIIQGQGTTVFVDEDAEKIAINAEPQNGRWVFVGQGTYGSADPAGTTRTYDTNIPASATDTDRNQFILYFTNQLTTSDSLGATPVQFVLRNIVRTDSPAAVVAVRTTGGNRTFRVWQTTYTPAGKTNSFVRLNVKRTARQRSDDIHVRMFTAFSPKSPVPTDGNVIEGNVLKGPPGPPGVSAGGTEALNSIRVLQDKTLDLEAGPAATGWANATLDSQGGMALQSGSAFDATSAQAATYSLNPQNPANKYIAVRVPAGTNARQVQLILTGADNAEYQYDLSSLHKLAATSTWDYYGDQRDLGLSVTNVVLQITSSTPHLGESTFSGNLTQEKVYDQVKEIVKGSNNITIESDDSAEELEIKFGGVNSDASLTGDGTVGSVLRVANPFTAAEKTKLAGLGDGLSEVSSDSSLTGLGTVDSPLEVATPFTASEKVKLGELTTDVTSDATLSGAGTTASPLKVTTPFSTADKAKLDRLNTDDLLDAVVSNSTLEGDGTVDAPLKVATPFTSSEKTKLDGLSANAIDAVASDATLSGDGTAGSPLKVAVPFSTAEKIALSDLRDDALFSVESDATLTGQGIDGSPLKVANPYTSAEKAKLASLTPGGLTAVSSDSTLSGAGTTGSPLKVATPFTTSEKTKLDGLISGAEAGHAVEVLQDKTYDLEAGPAASGWVNASNTGQAGLAVRSGGPFTLAQAESASFGLDPDDPGGQNLAVRVPRGTNAGQVQIVGTSSNSFTYTLQLSSFHKLGSTAVWDFYGENLAIPTWVVNLTAQVTSSAAHLGQTTFRGNLTQEKVYVEDKKIIKAGSNITVTASDGDGTLTIASTASGGGTAGGSVNTDVLDQRVDTLEDKTSDLQKGTDSVGWSNATLNSQGGIYTSNSALSFSQALALRNNQYSVSISSNVQSHLVVRIPSSAKAGQYRVQFRSGQNTLFEAALTGFTLLGSSGSWKYYLESHTLGTDVAALNLQVTGVAAHVGTSTFEGNLLQEKVYPQVNSIIKAGSNITISRDSDRSELTITATAGGGRSGLTSVSSDNTLSGTGTAGSPLKVTTPFTSAEKTKLASLSTDPPEVANGSITEAKLASAVTEKLLPAPTDRGRDRGKIAALNSGGTAYELVTPSTGLTSVIADGTLAGDGTTSSPLKVARPFTAADEAKLDGLSTAGLLSSVATNDTITGNGTAGSPLAVATPFTQAEKTKLAGLSSDGGGTTGGGSTDSATLHRVEALEGKTSDLQRGVDATGWVNANVGSQGGFYTEATVQTLSNATGRRRNNQWRRVVTSNIQAHLVVRIPTTAIASQYRVEFRSGTGTLFEEALTSFTSLGTSGSWKYYQESHTLGSDIASLTLQVTGSASHVGASVFQGQLTQENVYAQTKNVVKGSGGISASSSDSSEAVTLALASKGVTFDKLADAVAARLLPSTLGSAGQVLKVNSGATGVEYASGGGGLQVLRKTITIINSRSRGTVTRFPLTILTAAEARLGKVAYVGVWQDFSGSSGIQPAPMYDLTPLLYGNVSGFGISSNSSFRASSVERTSAGEIRLTGRNEFAQALSASVVLYVSMLY